LNLSKHHFTLSEIKIHSSFLHRDVTLTIILPRAYKEKETYQLLLINDGQDLAPMNFVSILENLEHKDEISSFITVGIHANENRIQEYGTVGQADYANRGALAGATSSFVLQELLPFLSLNYSCHTTEVVYAGFSLGGLMALDIVWANPAVFSCSAVFSGALWWRQKALDEGYQDVDRIMHAKIRCSEHKPGLKFWFQCGGRDETDDRDGDGIIDSIQDILECIGELERKGYKWSKDITYLEMPEGEHNVPTWALAMPFFLINAFGKKIELQANEISTAIW
jgi:enterochelin esterase-like enzyme